MTSDERRQTFEKWVHDRAGQDRARLVFDEFVAPLIEALERECHCTGEKDYDNKPVPCDVCDALAAVDKKLGEK